MPQVIPTSSLQPLAMRILGGKSIVDVRRLEDFGNFMTKSEEILKESANRIFSGLKEKTIKAKSHR